MPKLRDTQQEKQDKLFKGLVAKNMMIRGYEYNKDLAPKMHMHERTFNYKLDDPDKFTRKELRKLFNLLEFSEEEKGLVM